MWLNLANTMKEGTEPKKKEKRKKKKKDLLVEDILISLSVKKNCSLWVWSVFYVSLNYVLRLWEMICPQHLHNIFTTNLKWQVVIGCYLLGQKSNFSVMFKFKLITINHLWFVVKMLWTYHLSYIYIEQFWRVC